MLTRSTAWRYWIAFFALSDLSAHTHELCHHVIARIACGRWGTITFWLFFGPECGDGVRSYVSTFAGPLWTYFWAWIGALLILRGRHWLGIALVFAQLTWQRLLLSMFMNDEGWLRRALLPGPSGIVVEAVLLAALAVPPLVTAVRALRNAGRVRLLGPYLGVGLLAWFSFVGWNALSSALPLGSTWGMSRWYFVVVPAEAALVLALWRVLDTPAPDRLRT
jgi:hypothetical protein